MRVDTCHIVPTIRMSYVQVCAIEDFRMTRLALVTWSHAGQAVHSVYIVKMLYMQMYFMVVGADITGESKCK